MQTERLLSRVPEQGTCSPLSSFKSEHNLTKFLIIINNDLEFIYLCIVRTYYTYKVSKSESERHTDSKSKNAFWHIRQFEIIS